MELTSNEGRISLFTEKDIVNKPLTNRTPVLINLQNVTKTYNQTNNNNATKNRYKPIKDFSLITNNENSFSLCLEDKIELELSKIDFTADSIQIKSQVR